MAGALACTQVLVMATFPRQREPLTIVLYVAVGRGERGNGLE